MRRRSDGAAFSRRPPSDPAPGCLTIGRRAVRYFDILKADMLLAIFWNAAISSEPSAAT